MSQHEEHEEKLPALGQPPEGIDTTPDPDISGEYERTAVDPEIITDEDRNEREEESPRGWAGED